MKKISVLIIALALGAVAKHVLGLDQRLQEAMDGADVQVRQLRQFRERERAPGIHHQVQQQQAALQGTSLRAFARDWCRR